MLNLLCRHTLHRTMRRRPTPEWPNVGYSDVGRREPIVAYTPKMAVHLRPRDLTFRDVDVHSKAFGQGPKLQEKKASPKKSRYVQIELVPESDIAATVRDHHVHGQLTKVNERSVTKADIAPRGQSASLYLSENNSSLRSAFLGIDASTAQPRCHLPGRRCPVRTDTVPLLCPHCPCESSAALRPIPRNARRAALCREEFEASGTDAKAWTGRGIVRTLSRIS
jgi:hypothetical protein